MFNIILAIFFLAFAILSWRRLPWALMFLLAALPVYVLRFRIFSLPSTVLEGMILIAFAVWFFRYTHFKDFIRGRYGVKEFFANRKKRIPYPFGVEIILLLAVSLGAVFVSGFSLSALGIWRAYFFEPALLYVLLLNVFGRGVVETGHCPVRSGAEKIILSLSIGALAVSVYAIFQKITGLGLDNPLWAAVETRRVVSFFGYPNAVGLYLAPIIMILVPFLFLAGKNKEKKIYFPLRKENISAIGLSRGFLSLIIILSLLSVYFAKSEGALAGLLAAFVIFGLLSGRRAFFATSAILIIAIAGIFSYVPTRDYIIKKITLKDFSGQVRRAQWNETWKMLKENNRWLFGAGLANYQAAIAPYHIDGIFYDDGTDPEFHRHVVWNDEYKKQVWRPVEIYLYPHNIILNFWSELGLLGLLLFIWIFFKIIYHLSFIIYHSRQHKDKTDLFLALGLLAATIVILVHGLVDVPYFKNDLACLFWILVAILVLLELRLKNEEIENRKS